MGIKTVRGRVERERERNEIIWLISKSLGALGTRNKEYFTAESLHREIEEVMCWQAIPHDACWLC